MEKVRWGILGVSGHFIRRVLPSVSQTALTEILSVASRDPEKARNAALSYRIPHSCGSYEELLADRRVEAVYIPLPNHLHLEWIRKAADAGKHILCEKPLGMNAKEAQEALEYARKKGVLLMEAFMYPFHPQWQRVLDLVRFGEIGNVHTVHTIFTYNNANPADIRNQKAAGGGGLLDIGCYAVSAARRILRSEPSRALCLLSSDTNFGTDVLTSGILDFGTARSLFTVGTQSYPEQKVDIVGNRGKITVHLPFNAYADSPMRVTVTVGIGEREILAGPADQYALEMDAFSRAVLEKTSPPTPPEDAVGNMKVLDALFRSADSGAWERV